MVLYQHYNTDLLDIPEDKGRTAIAHVDGTLICAEADTSEEVRRKITEMMTKDNGVAKWSKDRILMDFAHHGNPRTPMPLHLPQMTTNRQHEIPGSNFRPQP